jgi:hypothetical protein
MVIGVCYATASVRNTYSRCIEARQLRIVPADLVVRWRSSLARRPRARDAHRSPLQEERAQEAPPPKGDSQDARFTTKRKRRRGGPEQDRQQGSRKVKTRPAAGFSPVLLEMEMPLYLHINGRNMNMPILNKTVEVACRV